MTKSLTPSVQFFGSKFEAKLQLLLTMALLYVSLNIVGSALAFKLVLVGPGIAPGGIFVLPLVMLLEDIIAEIFGYKITRFLLWLVLLSTLLFCTLTSLIVHLPSPTGATNQKDYYVVFSPLIKSGPTELLAVAVGRFINIYIITKFKVMVHGRFFWLRSIISTFSSSIISLLIYFAILFGGSQGMSGVLKLFLTDFSVRMIYEVIGVFPAAYLVGMVKEKLKINVFDYHTNFNPFKLSLKD